MYPDKSWKETSGMLANFVADSGAGKSQLSSIVGQAAFIQNAMNTYKFNFVSQLAKQYKDGWLFTGQQ